MRAQISDSRPHVSRGLDIGYGVALVTAVVFGAGPTYGLGHPGVATTTLVLLAANTALWLGRRASPAPWWGWSIAIAITGSAVTMQPDVAPGVALMPFIGVLLVGIDLGFWAGVAVTIAYSTSMCVWVLVAYDGPAANAFMQSAAFAVMMTMLAAIGNLIRTIDAARQEAEAAHAELSVANVKLRRALLVEGELVLAQERARSARELHDGLGHSLTLMSMTLQLAQRLRARDPERAWDEVQTAADTNAEALETMRRWVRALDPPGDADTLGGRDAFEAIAESFRGTGLDVRVRHRGEQQPLPADASLFATRFLQEGLTNVLRHAEANVVEINVQQSPQQLRLAIGDDGRGAEAPADGFGLRSLRERAELLGGTVTTGRPTLGGFEVAAILPVVAESGA